MFQSGMSSSVNLYAEFLLNIRQVTIYASLKLDNSADLNAFVSSDRKSLTVTYDGSSATIIFPSGVSGKATIEFPIQRRALISLRLEIAEDDKPSHGIGMEVANDSPWSADTLSPASQIACRACRNEILKPLKREWKDLPRDDWAEMMDLWHCHKPSETPSAHKQGANEGYAAMKRPQLTAGVGLVNTCHILLPEHECCNLKVSLAFISRNFFELVILGSGQQEGDESSSSASLWQGHRYNCPIRSYNGSLWKL
jgi:hypothetical protein